MTETAVPRASLAAPWPSMLLAGLVDELSSSGALTPEWRAAFLAVPRHLFVPDLVWREDGDGCGLQEVRRAEQPESWLEMVYRDEPVITQINDGASPGFPGAPPELSAARRTLYTSSTSMPSVVAEMLWARCEPNPG